MISKFTLAFIFLAIPCGGWAQNNSSADELILIEKKITDLKTQLNKEKIQAMNEEVESQELMIADWPAFAKEEEKIKQLQQHISQMQKEIDVLEQQKKALQKP